MSFLLFFFEKNNIIEPQMDGVVFVVLFSKRTTLLSRKRMIWVFCCSFFEKNNIIKPKMDGMSFLLFFFEKNNIIKPKNRRYEFFVVLFLKRIMC